MKSAATLDSSPQDRDTPCPPAESLARYIDGLADASETSQIESHVALCDDCLSVLAETSRQRKTNATLLSFGGYSWRPQPLVIIGLATAAAIVLLLIFPRHDPAADLALSVQRLQAAAGPYREYESRLTADTTYRQMASVTRSAGDESPAATSPAEEAKRTAAVDVQNAASAAPDHDAAARALGTMYFNLGDAGRAVEALEPLASSADGGVLNDLAAAYLARRADGDPQKALRILERVVEREPQRAEAWFNLGLAAEADDQRERAIEAWKKTLQLDGTSGWAAESRFRLQRLTTR